MRRFFFQSVITAFTIVGSIIGAGFISGKEIYEFFASDFSFSGIYLTFLLFAFLIGFTMQENLNETSEKAVGLFVSVANIFISGCMVAGLNEVYKSLFCQIEKVEILTVISAILIFIISCKGIGATEKLNGILIPIVIAVIIVFGLLKGNKTAVNLSPKTYGGVVKPAVYVGFNVILSTKVIKKSGEKLSPPFKILSSIITSLIVCMLIWVISLAVVNVDKSVEMPFRKLFVGNKKLCIIVDIITVFAIFTTLVSSFYTSLEIIPKQSGVFVKIIVFLLALAISKIGFSSIVERVYPTVGILSYAVIFITYLLSKIFLKGQRARTFLPLKRKV